MALAVTEEQVALAESVSGWAERAKLRQLAREQIDIPAVSRTTARPPWWPGAVELGLTGLALPEEVGGSGATVVELAVAVEELGRHVAHGPFVASAVAGLALTVARRAGDATPAPSTRCSPCWPRGRRAGAVALEADVTAGGRAGRAWSCPATPGWSPGLPGANWLLVPRQPRRQRDLGRSSTSAAGVDVEPVDSLDVTRRLARVTLEAAHRARGARALRARRRPGPRSVRHRRRGRSGRHRALGAGDGDRVREGARAVRPADRQLPVDQAPVLRHAGAQRTRRRGSLGRGQRRDRCRRG